MIKTIFFFLSFFDLFVRISENGQFKRNWPGEFGRTNKNNYVKRQNTPQKHEKNLQLLLGQSFGFKFLIFANKIEYMGICNVQGQNHKGVNVPNVQSLESQDCNVIKCFTNVRGGGGGGEEGGHCCNGLMHSFKDISKPFEVFFEMDFMNNS